ncbi:MAG TPA: class I SAM-dependent methyltransferase [Thermoanaerobaculaceae bacterium]|nr:class I SAM-dependent methyltransferase [Thermoanaerobaculaceae bacterium]
MAQPVSSKPEYANWVAPRLVYGPAALAVLLGGLAAFALWFLLPALLCLACASYFAYAQWVLSEGGGDVQRKIQALVLQQLHWKGTGATLDIGCGNGSLAIAIAKAYPLAHVTGIDSWGRSWEYSQAACDRNASIEGVTKQVSFQKASAARLPFPEGAFDVVVSNLVFHEVRDVADKKLLLKEALRVLKKGGIFVLQDLFLWRRVYGDIPDLLSAIRSWGVASAEFFPTNGAPFIPRALKLPFMVGTIGIIHGRK